MLKLEHKPFDYSIVLCPKCGGGYLHHGEISIYDRDEDLCDSPGRRVKVGQSVLVDSNVNGNPSRRRNGITINFWCEECDSTSVMVIAQHKGETLIDLIYKRAEK